MVNKQKTWLPKTLKCSKSKTIRNRKRKSSHHVDLKRSLFSFLGLFVLDLEHFKGLDGLFFLFSLYISIMHLCHKNLFTHFFVTKFEFTHFFIVWKFLHAKVCSPESLQLFCLCLWLKQKWKLRKITCWKLASDIW